MSTLWDNHANQCSSHNLPKHSTSKVKENDQLMYDINRLLDTSQKNVKEFKSTDFFYRVIVKTINVTLNSVM